MGTGRAPRGWKKRVKRALLNVISLGRVCTSALEAEDTTSSDLMVRESAELDALHRELRLLRAEIALKDARMTHVPARRRPHYSATERMRILELKTARGWSTAEAARCFHVSEATIASWLRSTDRIDVAPKVQLREPVNKFPDLVRVAVQRLKTLCPRLGKDKIAEMFCRAGVEISSSTVSRIVKEPAPATPPPTASRPLVRVRAANEAWLIDLTAVPIVSTPGTGLRRGDLCLKTHWREAAIEIRLQGLRPSEAPKDLDEVTVGVDPRGGPLQSL